MAWKFRSSALLLVAGIALGLSVPRTQGLLDSTTNPPIDSPAFVKLAMQSSVYLDAGDSAGSGFYVAPHYILATFHGFDSAKNEIQLEKRDGTKGKAIITWIDLDDDLVLLYTKIEGAPVDLECTLPEVGEKVMSIGSPIEMKFLPIWGMVISPMDPNPSAKETYSRISMALQIPILPGDSGGQVYNARGKVVGIMDGYFVYPVTDLNTGLDSMSTTGLSYMASLAPVCNKINMALLDEIAGDSVASVSP